MNHQPILLHRSAIRCRFVFPLFLLLFCTAATSIAQTVTWAGTVSSAYFTAANWNPSTNPAALAQTEIMMIGNGSPYNCVHSGGSSANAYRPGKLNVLSGATFTVNGTLYPWSSDSLNGNITINTPGDLSVRNIAYVGRNTSGTVITITGGKLSNNNVFNIATGNAGSDATINLQGGSLTAGTNLNLANGTGLTGRINITGGALIIPATLGIGANGSIYISGIGYIRMAGNKTTQLNSLVADGRLSCTPGKTLSITYDGTYTYAQIPQNPNSLITEYPDSVVLKTGAITINIAKNSSNINSYRYRGVEMGGSGKMYTDMQTPYAQLTRCVYSVKTDSTGLADVSFKQTWLPGADSIAMDHDVHYAVKKGDSAVYVYIIRRHPAAYPATHLDENRYVWKINQDYTERICVDSARTWVMPNSYDYSQASSTGIAEIIKINTGVRAGQYDCKYEFSKEYWNIGTYGHASDVNKVGVWAVFGGYDFFNDGPTKQDLTAAAGIIHVHFGLDHYMGSNIVLAAGEEWSKMQGPFLFYTNYHPGGSDSLWANARVRADSEKAQWPYSWLTNEPNYPNKAGRGTVKGRFVINDPFKTSVNGAFAMVGLASPDPGVNWQFDSKHYEYWVKTDAAGNFIIPDIRPGTYTLYAFATGEIKEYSLAGITVIAPDTTDAGTLTWNISRTRGPLLWEIGIPDRKAQEFKHGNDYFLPYKFLDYSAEFTNPLRYKVGQSNWSADINYAHSNYLRPTDSAWVTWPWNIYFDAASLTPGDSVKLTLAFSGGESSRMDMYINDTSYSSLLSRFYITNGDGNILLREGIHGKYWDTAVYIPVSKLRTGTNVLTLIMGRAGASANHFMYDYISMEGNLATTLPVGLLSFTAEAVKQSAQLQWATSTETGTNHFEIQRSGNAANGFGAIGTVAAAGNSFSRQNYVFTDTRPLNGINYYRLKQVDNDGRFIYSDVRQLRFNEPATIKIYPNPARDAVTIQSTGSISLYDATITDAMGKTWITVKNINAGKTIIRTSSLAAGLYFIKINTGDGIKLQQFNKQ